MECRFRYIYLYVCGMMSLVSRCSPASIKHEIFVLSLFQHASSNSFCDFDFDSNKNEKLVVILCGVIVKKMF